MMPSWLSNGAMCMCFRHPGGEHFPIMLDDDAAAAENTGAVAKRPKRAAAAAAELLSPPRPALAAVHRNSERSAKLLHALNQRRA